MSDYGYTEYTEDGPVYHESSNETASIDYGSDSAPYGYKIPVWMTDPDKIKGWREKAKEINDIKTTFKTSGYGESAYKLYSLMKSNNIVTEKQLLNAISKRGSEELGDIETWEYKNIKESIRSQMREARDNIDKSSNLDIKVLELRGKEFDMSVMSGWKPKSKTLSKK